MNCVRWMEMKDESKRKKRKRILWRRKKMKKGSEGKKKEGIMIPKKMKKRLRREKVGEHDTRKWGKALTEKKGGGTWCKKRRKGYKEKRKLMKCVYHFSRKTKKIKSSQLQWSDFCLHFIFSETAQRRNGSPIPFKCFNLEKKFLVHFQLDNDSDF